MVRESDDKKLSRFVAAAKDLGATDTKIVDTEDIIVDKRVRLKCAIPICADYGRHLLCPPNVISVDEFSGIVRLYRKAIILQIEADVDSSDKSKRYLDRDVCRSLERSTGAVRWERKLHKLVNQMEAIAFKQGFYLAAGLIGGNCHLCRECIAPQSGKLCRHPFEARPSMEAMGIDVVKTCKRAGLSLNLSSKKRVRWTGLVLLD
jgi:predicted metal-binding protein